VRGIVYGWARSLFGVAPPAPFATTLSVFAIPHLRAMAKQPTPNLKLEEGYSWAQ